MKRNHKTRKNRTFTIFVLSVLMVGICAEFGFPSFAEENVTDAVINIGSHTPAGLSLELDKDATTGNTISIADVALVDDDDESTPPIDDDYEDFTYQWKSTTAEPDNNGQFAEGAWTDIDGATGTSYAVSTDTAGTVRYYCLIRAKLKEDNKYAVRASSVFTVTVSEPTPPDPGKTDPTLTTAPAAVSNLVYDGTLQTLVTGGIANGGTVKYSLTADGTYLTAVPQKIAADTYDVYYMIEGDETHNNLTYSDNLPGNPISVTIAPKPVKVSGITAYNKVYDGNTTATLDTSLAEFDGVVSTDVLTVSATGTFADAEIGLDKTVTITGMTLGGTSAFNYEIDTSGSQTTATADIQDDYMTVAVTGDYSFTGLEITPTFTVTGKDGKAIKASDYTVVFSDGTNADKIINAGTAYISVTVKDSEGRNHTVREKFNVAKARLSAGKIKYKNASLTYNGTEQEVEITSIKVGNVDITSDCTVSNNRLTDAGTYKIRITVSGNPNMEECSANAQYVIKPKEVKVTGLTATKEYDGKTNADIDVSNAVIEGIVSGDDVSVESATGAFKDASAGTGKELTISKVVLKGADKDNYKVTSYGDCKGSISGKEITPIVTISGTYKYTGREITPSFTVTYNGQTLPSSYYTTELSDNTDAGTATLTVSSKDNSPYTFDDIEKTFKIEKAVKTYTGSQTITADAEDTTLEDIEDKLADGWEWRDSDRERTIVNGMTATAVYTEDEDNYSGRVTIMINKSGSSYNRIPEIIINKSYKYTGMEITPSFSVTYKGQILSRSLYTYEFYDNIDVGTATLVVYFNSNSGIPVDSIESSFEIEKTEIKYTGPTTITAELDDDYLYDLSDRLPDGWEWSESDYDLEIVNGMTATAVYTEDDRYTGSTTITIKKPIDISSYLIIDDDGLIIEYTGEEVSEVVVPNNVDGITVIGIGDDVFRGHKEIISIVLPDLLESIGDYAFKGVPFGTDDKPGEIVIPASVDYIGAEAFSDCAYLKSVSFESSDSGTIVFNAISGKSNTFASCPRLSRISLSEKVIDIPVGFAHDCIGLESVVYPRGLKTIGGEAFKNCVKLRISRLSATSLESIGDEAYKYCASFPAVVFPKTLVSIGHHAFAECGLGSEEAPGSITIPSSIRYLGSYAFYKSGYLEEVVFDSADNSVAVITLDKPDGYSNQFAENSHLKRMVLSDGIVSIPAGFAADCFNLTEIKLGNRLTNIEKSAFHVNLGDGISKIKTILISESDVARNFDWDGENRSLVNRYRIVFHSNEPDGYDQEMYQDMLCGKRDQLNSIAFSVKYYTFIAWNTKADGTGKIYTNKAKVRDLAEKDETMDLYAMWRANVFTVSYDANPAGTNGGKALGKMKESRIPFDKSDQKIRPVAFSVKGYIFDGWNTRADGKGISILDEASLLRTLVDNELINETHTKITLFAQWEPVVYSVDIFDYTNPSVSVLDTASVEYGKKLDETDAIGDTVWDDGIKPGYKLSYLTDSLKKNSTKINLSNKNLTAEQGKNIKLYAVWEPIQYSIRYELDGGKNPAKAKYRYTITDSDYEFLDPVRKGYTFVKWVEASSYNPQTAEEIYKIEKGSHQDISLRAVWEENRYNLIIDSNTDQYTETSTQTFVLDYTDEISFFDIVEKFEVSDGYSGKKSIKAFTSKPNGKGKKYKPGSVLSRLSALDDNTVTLYAQWGPAQFRIMYDDSECTIPSSNPQTYTFSKKKIYIKPPVRKGYSFTGWEVLTPPTTGSFDVKKNCINPGSKGLIFLSPTWKQVSYNVKLINNNKKATEIGQTTFTNLVYGTNESFNAQYVYDNPLYDLVGFNTKANGKGRDYGNGNISLAGLGTKNDATIKLYAIWKPKKYNITYVNIDPDIRYVAGDPNSQLLSVKNRNSLFYTAIKKTSLKNASKYGFDFKGWYLYYNSRTGAFSERVTQIPKGSTGDIVLYGRWEVK